MPAKHAVPQAVMVSRLTFAQSNGKSGRLTERVVGVR
jgi:hypothetical protein